MNSVIKGNQAAMLKVHLNRDQGLFIAQDRVMACSNHLIFSRRSDGGIWTKLARKFSRSNFVYQEVHAEQDDQWIMMAPAMYGAITTIDMRHHEYLVAEANSILAAQDSVHFSQKISPAEETGLETVTISGKGSVYLGGHGAIENMVLMPGQKAFVTPGYLLAFERGVVAEKLVDGMVQISGPGQVWLQTRLRPYTAATSD